MLEGDPQGPSASMLPAADPLIGRVLNGRFRVVEPLGSGGMGKVYKVKNVISDRVEAMKILLPNLASQKELADRFLREIKVLASLHHPNIAELRTALTMNNQLVMIMEYVEGETLRHRIGRPLSITEFLSIATQCAAALTAAHKAGLLHRDIKPENIMLTRDGQVKALDFGVARELPGSDHATTRHTFESARFAGTLPYMAPEILEEKEGDGRADIFSLGVVFYESLSGKNPFRRPGFLDTCNAILHQDPPRLSRQNSDVPEGIELPLERARM